MVSKLFSIFKPFFKQTFLFALIALSLLAICSESAGSFAHGSFRRMACTLQTSDNIENCSYGMYKDICNKAVCYKGPGEYCDARPTDVRIYGQCAPSLACGFGECTGCIDELCYEVILQKKGLYFNKNDVKVHE